MEWNRGEGEGEGGTEGQACPDAERPSWPETLAAARGEQEGRRAAPRLPWFSPTAHVLSRRGQLSGARAAGRDRKAPSHEPWPSIGCVDVNEPPGLTTWREKNVTTQT